MAPEVTSSTCRPLLLQGHQLGGHGVDVVLIDARALRERGGADLDDDALDLEKSRLTGGRHREAAPCA